LRASVNEGSSHTISCVPAPDGGAGTTIVFTCLHADRAIAVTGAVDAGEAVPEAVHAAHRISGPTRAVAAIVRVTPIGEP
jgi:hypothetical protein